MDGLAKAVLRRWPALALVASALMLAIAYAFQIFGGLAPCTLCFYQRDVYWVALPIAALCLLAGRAPLAKSILGGLLALTFLTGAAIATWHAGAEWKFWPGPATCSGGGAATAAGLASLMRGAKISAPRCDEAAWRWLGLSMAGWNVLISLGLFGFSAAWAAWRPRRD